MTSVHGGVVGTAGYDELLVTTYTGMCSIFLITSVFHKIELL